jgi:hypothetical protein
MEIRKSKVIHMLVEDIKPGLVLANPFKTGHLNINTPLSVVCLSEVLEERYRIWDVLQHMSKDQSFSLNPYAFFKKVPLHFGVAPFVCGIKACDIKSCREHHFQKESLAATNFHKVGPPHPPIDDFHDLMQVLLKMPAKALLVLIVGIVDD